ncbi:response regulator [Hyphococcus flavus]|uniref:histidine kinase n=1 Tax=Hyphococcus flavus TaxID=1866326 RepID=A0AAE9ZBD9_9PROT|nr:response regulator [Hyphococcus flavus]WDI30035.1 response regulator [Hyphococcus flavus]
MASGTSIILVDDDPVMRELATAKLIEAGYVVHQACNGAEGLKLVQTENVSLVISDIDMPVMNGYELTEAIRKDDAISETPVMVITASDRADAVDRAFAAGATSFLAKPMNWSLFNHAVKFVLRASDDRKALRTARDQAEAGARFKDSLMSVMSHELRTPLNAIIGFGQIIAEQFGKEKDNLHQEYADYIIDSGRRLLNSVSDMLLASDARSGPIAINDVDVSASELIEEAVAGLQKTMDLAEAETTIRMASSDIEITCDRVLVARAVQKLIDNAVKFSPKGVKILIGGALTKQGDLAIVVKDDGPGISADKLDDVCAPFAQMDMSIRRSKEGLGLGLPLVQAIAAAHGGVFRLDSTPGEGTRAILSFPSSRVRSMSKASAQSNSNQQVA